MSPLAVSTLVALGTVASVAVALPGAKQELLAILLAGFLVAIGVL